MTKYFLTILTFLNFTGFGQVTFDTKAFGQKILNGQVKYSDGTERKFMQTLDSVFCKTQADKSFYFKTANKIFKMADGVLGEYCSGIASRYYLEHNLEFVNSSLTISPKEIDEWLEQAAFDIAASADGIKDLPKIKKQLDKLLENCKCEASKATLIKKYNEKLYKQVEQNIKSNAG